MAASWKVTQPGFIGAQPITDVSTTKNHQLGTIVKASDTGDDDRGDGEFIYLQGVASTVAGDAVLYNADDYSTTRVTADGIGPIAIAMAATVASTYGWYQIQGKGSVQVSAGFPDNANCYLTDTAGEIDDEDDDGDFVSGMKGASAVSGGVADMELSRPFVRDGLDN
tara:strand:+ start:9786 stop:10286 length:501 start_codon:yes stop_codon:yes gene_type:complete